MTTLKRRLVLTGCALALAAGPPVSAQNPVLSISSASATSEGAGFVTFTVTRTSTGVARDLTVRLNTYNGSATGSPTCGGNADFASQQGTPLTFSPSESSKTVTDPALRKLTFNPGVRSQFINVPTCLDAVHESQEVFKVTLSKATNANISGGVGRGRSK